MRMRVAVAVLLLLAMPAIGLTQNQKGGSPQEKILEFGTMVGVSGPFRGSANNIRGINGAGAPWTLASAKGELKTSGVLEISVRGLVLVSTGVNPLTTFRAAVSCLTTDASGTAAATSNIRTDPFPATTTGDADVEAFVALPTPCIAPIVFVTTAGGSWLAVTGR